MTASDLVRKIDAKQSVVGIIGLGYVGLPLVLSFAHNGFHVRGFDVDEAKIEALNKGESYIRAIPGERIEEARVAGFTATSDYDRLRGVDAAIICVPTPLGPHREPDLSYIENTAEALAGRLRPGQLVVLESTTYPGTTREVLIPILERSGLRAGADFFVGFSPEREDPGNVDFSTSTIPKIVSGLTPECLEATVGLYSQVVTKVVPVESLEVAELAKLLENIYRAANIALVNELKMVCDRMGVNVWSVIDAAATKPFGFTPFYPGPGIGGHCIPIDPYYLTWRAREFGLDTRFIELAGQVNDAMPQYVVNRMADELNAHGKCLSRAKVLCLGVAYKRNMDDLRESPALDVMELLRHRGVQVSYHDPYVPRLHPTRRHDIHLESVPLSSDTLGAADVVLILTDHSGVDYQAVVRHASLVLDTRNATSSVTEGREKIKRA